jgi:hypothetical protein
LGYAFSMPSRPKANRVEALVEGLSMVQSDPNGREAQRRIREALAHKHWMPVEHAARLVGQLSLAGFAKDLVGVWGRFVNPGAKLDPGCRAKQAALLALDTLECFDPDPFLVAIRYVQLEPGYGGATDTAGGVRQRALFALLRQHHSQALLYAGELLADPLVEVRLGTADALCQCAGANAASLLVHRLRAGDDPRVLLACAAALLEIEGPFARAMLAQWLRQSDEDRREVSALALGQDKSEDAAELLIAWLDDMAWDKDIELAARALALHRSEPARRCLLAHIESGSATCARAAITALAVHRYDRQLSERVREAARRNADPALGVLVDNLYQVPLA